MFVSLPGFEMSFVIEVVVYLAVITDKLLERCDGAVRGTSTSLRVSNKHISMPHKVGATQSKQRYGFA